MRYYGVQNEVKSYLNRLQSEVEELTLEQLQTLLPVIEMPTIEEPVTE